MTRRTSSVWGLSTEPEQWRLRAACIGYDPEWWTVAGASDLTGKANNALAAGICEDCPVAAECLDYGLRTGSTGVIFGGKELLVGTPGSRQRHCRGCGVQFTAAWRHQVFCTKRCAQRQRTVRRVERLRRERAYVTCLTAEGGT